MKTITDLHIKNAAVLGLSVEGCSTAKFLLERGVAVTACDRNDPRQSNSGFKDLERLGIKVSCGEKYLDNLDGFDTVFRTPGMPLDLPQLVKAGERGVVVSSQTKLFFDLCPCPIIGVTGTKGKGTTSTLIYEILKKGGFDAYLGGNIGTPPLDFIGKLGTDSHAVLELSSFQLEDLDVSPSVAVVLMVTAEHLDSRSQDSPNYHKTLAAYLRAKENVVRYQKPGDCAVINKDYPNSRDFAVLTKGSVYYFSRQSAVKPGVYTDSGGIYFRKDRTERVCSVSAITLRGDHNRENVFAAITVAKILDIGNEVIREAVRDFKGLEHRLEPVRTVNGVSYYNDSFSTTPETVIAALRSFKEPLILILGGSEKGSDYSELARELHRAINLKAVILIGRTAGQILAAVESSGGFGPATKVIRGLTNMRTIIDAASHEGQQGDVVLLSPGCASFDMFKDYKDRGSQFKMEVNRL